MNQFLDPFVGVRISYTKSWPNQHTINNITKKIASFLHTCIDHCIT